MKRGAFVFEGGVTDTVEALTGKPAESFETTARRYAALPFALPTTGNRTRAVLNFLATPLMPGFNVAKLDRTWGYPMPSNPRSSIDDERWRAEHVRIMAEQPRVVSAEVTPSGVM